MFIYRLCIHHLLFMELISLGRLDCFALSSLKFIVFFSDYFTTYQCHFHPPLPVRPTSRLHVVCATQVSGANVNKDARGGNPVLETRLAGVSQNSL